VLHADHRAQAPLEFEDGRADGELSGSDQGPEIVEDALGLGGAELTVEIVVGDSHGPHAP
jgi:hypothetical protein